MLETNKTTCHQEEEKKSSIRLFISKVFGSNIWGETMLSGSSILLVTFVFSILDLYFSCKI
jgi:hypothetical protein